METLRLFLGSHTIASTLTKVVLILSSSLLLYVFVKWLVFRVVLQVAEQTETLWDNVLEKNRVFHSFYYLAPSVIWYYGTTLFPTVEAHAKRLVLLYVLYHSVVLVDRLLSAGRDIYHHARAEAERRSIKVYVQAIRLFLYFSGTLIAVALLLDKPLLTLLSGIGALTAILLLIFRDTLLSFIASLQISSHDMFHVGDSISMPQYGADGTVIDISLHKVKIQNWDKTIVAIPTFKFIDEPFTNWRGVSDSGGRRIKRALYLDQTSVMFCDDAMLQGFEEVDILRDFVRIRRAEILEHNAKAKLVGKSPINGRCMTNLGTFRYYVRAYLENHPNIHKGMPLLVRHLAPSAKGIGLEIYAFTDGVAWSHYEGVQADIFDHLLAALPEFGLRIFQAPTGFDVTSIGGDAGFMKACSSAKEKKSSS